jgi:DNA-binding transcriptional LysR family regulator
MDRIEAMTVLVAVAEAGSLSAAGRRLGQPLSTVSRKLSDLEAHLGARLLLRTSRSVTLTEAGHSYVAACRRILGDLAEADRAAAGEYGQARGDLVVTAPVVFGRRHLVPVIAAFLLDHPAIDVTLTLSDRMLHLLDDHVDVALRIGALPDSSLVALRLGEVRPVVCASPAYLARRGTPQRPADLAGHCCITFTALSVPDRWSFPSGDVAVHARLSVNTAEAAIDAAEAGLGITRVLSYQIAPLRRAGRMLTVLDGFAPDPVPVSLVHPGQGRMPQKLRAFLDFAAPRLRAALQGLDGPAPPGANPLSAVLPAR